MRSRVPGSTRAADARQQKMSDNPRAAAVEALMTSAAEAEGPAAARLPADGRGAARTPPRCSGVSFERARIRPDGLHLDERPDGLRLSSER